MSVVRHIGFILVLITFGSSALLCIGSEAEDICYGGLNITYNKNVECNEYVSRVETVTEPSVTFNNATSNALYTLIMVDKGDCTSEATKVYWLVLNIQKSSLKDGHISGDEVNGRSSLKFISKRNETEYNEPQPYPSKIDYLLRLYFLILEQQNGSIDKLPRFDTSNTFDLKKLMIVHNLLLVGSFQFWIMY